MDPWEIAEVFFLFVEFCDLNSCLRLMRVDRRFRDWLGTSKIWKKFVNTNPDFHINQNYFRAVSPLIGNKIIPSPITFRNYYGEEYYTFVFSKFTLKKEFSLSNLIGANAFDFEKTIRLFLDSGHGIGSWFSPSQLNQISRKRKRLSSEFKDDDFQVLKKILLNPYYWENSIFALDAGKWKVNFRVRRLPKSGKLEIAIFRNARFDWSFCEKKFDPEKTYLLIISENGDCPNDQYWHKIVKSVNLDSTQLFEIISKMTWLIVCSHN